MSNEESFEIELPDWVKVLLKKADETAYDRGCADGERWQYERTLKAVERLNPS